MPKPELKKCAIPGTTQDMSANNLGHLPNLIIFVYTKVNQTSNYAKESPT